MNLLKLQGTLKARCATYANNLILSSMDTEQQRAALAGSISVMYASLSRRGFFSTNPNETYLPAIQEEVDQLEYFKSLWSGTVKIREAQRIVDQQIVELDAVSIISFDVILQFNTILSGL